MKVEILKLVREKTSEYSVRDLRANIPCEIARIIQRAFDAKSLPEEHFFLISMDTRGHVLGLFDMAHGQKESCVVSQADILKRVLLTNGGYFAVAHNHPSGDASVSNADITLTEQLLQAADIVGVKLVDHVVIGDNEYISIRERNPEIFE